MYSPVRNGGKLLSGWKRLTEIIRQAADPLPFKSLDWYPLDWHLLKELVTCDWIMKILK